MFEEIEDQKKTILEAIENIVPEEFLAEAEDVVEMYREDRLGLMLLEEFYSFPPDSREDWVRAIRVINRQRGIFLLAVVTSRETYQYLVSSEGLEFQGRLTDGFLADELLDFFGYASGEAFRKVSAAAGTLPIYEPLQFDEDICPACHAVAGEYHELGCPVEICPWCGGQLIHCDCRFEKLGLDAISSEEELLEFEALLEHQGRIPYSQEQRPSFATDGPNSVFD